jgi:hypothetical protein
MSGVIHHTGMLRLWSSYTQPVKKGKPKPNAWLGQQRKNVNLLRYYLIDFVLKLCCNSSDRSYVDNIKSPVFVYVSSRVFHSERYHYTILSIMPTSMCLLSYCNCSDAMVSTQESIIVCPQVRSAMARETTGRPIGLAA